MEEEMLWNGIKLLTSRGQFPFSTDSVACAWFSRFRKGSKVADLCCGGGAIAMMLLASDPTLLVTGVELQEDAFRLAQANEAQSGLSFHPLLGDVRQISALLPAGSMDGVIANPPYFPTKSGKQAAGAAALARSEDTCTLAQLAQAASWLLRWGGTFVLVHRPERLADLIWELRSCRLEPKRLRFVRHSPSSKVSLVLLEAKKGGHPGLEVQDDLLLFGPDGLETEEYQRMYHRL